MKKWLALLLAAALCLSAAGCGPTGGQDEPTPSPSPSASGTLPPDESPSPSPSSAADSTPFLPDNEIDTAQELAGIPRDATLLTVNGKDVSAETYLYWLGSMASYYSYLYNMYYYSTLDFASEMEEGVTWGERLKEYAYNNVVLTCLAPDLGEKYGISLTDEDMAELYKEREEKISQAGGSEVFAYQLQGMGISDRALFQVDQDTYLYDKVMSDYIEKALAGQGDGALTDESVDAYIEENDLLRAKHILLMTVDSTTREPLDEAAIAEKRAKIDEIAQQLADAEDPIALFDTLMNENSEDTGLSTNPDGYVFTAGEMVTEFEQGTRALEVGEISPVIESSYGYHIILRLDADCQETREKAATQSFTDMVNAMVAAATVETAPEYDAIETGDYYAKLLEFQNGLTNPAESPSPSLEPYESAEPTESATPVPTEG